MVPNTYSCKAMFTQSLTTGGLKEARYVVIKLNWNDFCSLLRMHCTSALQIYVSISSQDRKVVIYCTPLLCPYSVPSLTAF